MNTRAALILGAAIVLAALILALAPGPGRYQFARTAGVNVFVLDTRTGRLYRKFAPTSQGPTEWREETALPWRQ
jgi:hypothetical protein